MNYVNTVNEFEEGVYFFAEAPTMFPLPSDEKMCTSVCLFVGLSLCLFMGMLQKEFKKKSYENHLRRENVYEKGF